MEIVMEELQKNYWGRIKKWEMKMMNEGVLYNESQKVGQEETRRTYQQDIMDNDRRTKIKRRNDKTRRKRNLLKKNWEKDGGTAV